ncbi:MAG TPA: cupin domain-containing protein [Fimbriimonadaceae bacterium]|nr:cupin domain-containing protein [Fimbriimonadaceae bacterium]
MIALLFVLTACCTQTVAVCPVPQEADGHTVVVSHSLDIDDSINTKCPFSGQPIVESSLGLYRGRVVGFCNTGCRDKFVADPDAWPKAKAYFDTLITEMDQWHKPWGDTIRPLNQGAISNVWQQPDASILVYAPKGKDDQTPHERDEVYMVISGSGKFQRGDETVSFKPGDLLFVPKGMEHRFVEFTDDFKTWVVFYGPRD